MKTRKLKCVVTGKVLFATKDYYDRKLAACDDDPDKLVRSYVCKEAKKLIKQGYSVESIREMLDISMISKVDDDVLNDILNDNKSYLRGKMSDQVPGLVNKAVHRTDPEVKAFIERITAR